MSRCNFKTSDTQGMPFILDRFSKRTISKFLCKILIQFMMFSKLYHKIFTYSWLSCSLIASCSAFFIYSFSTMKKSSFFIFYFYGYIYCIVCLANSFLIYSGSTLWSEVEIGTFFLLSFLLCECVYFDSLTIFLFLWVYLLPFCIVDYKRL